MFQPTPILPVPELLAPAGNLECLHAAVRAGADAVYLGLDEFNARRNADNFARETLEAACDYAHLRGVAVYVALNVEILPGEFTRAIECAQQAYLCGADALIVQDIGLAAELKRTLPQMPVHASTQMNIHNAAGIEAAAHLGITRVTLARELTLPEIAELSALSAAFGMEVECFAHGALCICYSGQCLMSSMIGGRSANRGLCAQACRLPYELHREDRSDALPSDGDHLLSPRDLCSIELIEKLRDAGVASLKIEGRMKSADYVHEVVSVYREALDAMAFDDDDGHREEELALSRKRRLAEAFSRGFTTAYLEGKRDNDIMSYGRPNNRGVFVGRVARAEGNHAEIAAETRLNAGDIVEFWTNRGHFTANIEHGCEANERISVNVEQRTGKGDRVFRVRNAATAFVDDTFEPRVPVTGEAILEIGNPARVRFASLGGASGEARSDDVEPARTKALSAKDVRAHIDRLGQTPFTLTQLDIEMDDGVGMGFSRLHHLRANALNALESNMLAPWKNREAEPYHRVKKSSARPSSRNCEIVAWATNPGCARAAKRAGAERVYVPLLNFRRGQAQVKGVRQEETEQAGYPKQCVMALSAIDHDPLPETREGQTAFDPWDYVNEGKPVFADSLAGAVRAIGLGAHVEIGPHVPITNNAALRFAAEIGVKRVWLSPELSLGQISELAENSPVELGLFVSGFQELMICEHCLLMSQGPCAEDCEKCPRRSVSHYFTDRKGFEFPLATDMMGRSHLYNGVELDAVPVIPDLVQMGISAVMVDATFMDKKTTEAAVKRTVRAVEFAENEGRGMERRPGTTTGHLFRGVS